VPRELAAVLERAWLASDQLSGKLLRPILPALLTALTRHGLSIAPPVRTALTRASAATLDRLLRPLRRRRPRQPRRLAPALASLRAQIPLRTWSEWTDVGPGALQGDLVLHCGESTAGRYCATLVAVDVATSWTELQALVDLHHQRVTGAIQHVYARLPFPLREWHSDNGSEFINAALLGWCRRQGIRFTRGRPYRKNDQAWVEQRNGLLVRRLVGYDRFSSRAAWTVLQRLYDLLRLQHNFFRPMRKLRSKRRLGAKVLKRYDAAQTPYQRVLAAGGLTPDQRQTLAAQFHVLDPIALARDIQRTLDVLWPLADTRSSRPETAHG
jgi:transposase InsO family protein